MSPHAWRRTHGPDITSEVVSDGRGAWRAKVYLTSNRTVTVTTPLTLETLSSAQEKADALARKTFDHRCEAACGPWIYHASPSADE
jgi:hypothetical protein